MRCQWGLLTAECWLGLSHAAERGLQGNIAESNLLMGEREPPLDVLRLLPWELRRELAAGVAQADTRSLLTAEILL